LLYDNTKTTAIQGAFDPDRGVLILIGKAKAAYYTDAIRNIRYDYKETDDAPLLDTAKHIYIYVSDGQTQSQTRQRTLTMVSNIKLDIPIAFTPNGDTANDTWKIRSTNTSDDYKDALVRVYNIRGTLVYEAIGLDKEWDGKYKDVILPADTYYYTINLNLDYTRATYQGIVTILH
jgi:gliding motility-associated-like protein